MAIMTEEDILAGDFICPRALQKVLINQATGLVPEGDDWAQLKGEEGPDEPPIFTGI